MAPVGLNEESMAMDAGRLGGARTPSHGGWRLPVEFLIAPFALAFVGVFLVPVVYMILQSFKSGAGEMTFANYTNVVLSPTSRAILMDTATATGAVTIGCLVLGFAVALAIYQAPSYLRAALLLAVIAPFFVSVTVRIFGWLALSSPPSPLPYIFDRLFGDTTLRTIGLPLSILALIQIFLPFAVLPTLASIAKIDPTITRSARSLGASKARVARKVVLPLVIPGLVTGAVLVFAQTISSFFVPAILGGGFLVLLPNVVVNNISFYYQPNEAAAAAALLAFSSLLVILVATAIVRRRAGIYRGRR